jgi:XTP/dITP diphosphohydrolase
MRIWFASGSVHKKAELAAIFNTEIATPADVGLEFCPDETGASFHENALLKARALWRQLEERRPARYRSGEPVIADDSGLCVDALDGRPGIFSARYGRTADGKKLGDQERNALLLAELGDNPRRSARFVCAMVCFWSPGRFCLAQETLEGEIVQSAERAGGAGGFGYDPVFWVPGLGRTVAELAEAEKNRISHRGKAGRVIAGMIRNIQPRPDQRSECGAIQS